MKTFPIKSILFTVLLMVIFITVMIIWPFSTNDSTTYQVVQHNYGVTGGKVEIRSKAGFYYSGFGSDVYTYDKNVTIQTGPKERWADESDYAETGHKVTFSGGDQAEFGETVKWSMPVNNEQRIAIHQEYGSQNNLMTTTLLQYQKETGKYACQSMDSETHYSGGQAQLKNTYSDYLRNGVVITTSATEVVTDTLNNTTKKVIKVRPKTDAEGNVIRETSDIQVYGITPSFVSIDFVRYDALIMEKLQKKIELAAKEATSKQGLITAQQEAETAKIDGERQIAVVKAKEEADEQREIIRARKEKLIAKEKLEQAKLDAAAVLVAKKAEAEGDKLKVAAGLSPLEKAKIEQATAIGVAEALAKRPVPTFVTNGSGGQSGLAQSYTMENMLLLQKQLTDNNK